MYKKIMVSTLIIMTVALVGCGKRQVYQTPVETVNNNQVVQSTDSSKDTTKEQPQQSPENKPNTESSTQNQTNSNIQDDQPEEAFFGQWVIKRQLAYGPVGTYSNDDIKAIIGKKLTFSKEKASCFGDQISDLNNIAVNPSYKKAVIARSDFESENRITFDKLGMKNQSITKFDVRDSKGNGCTIYIKDTNTLILYGGGVYFELERV